VLDHGKLRGFHREEAKLFKENRIKQLVAQWSLRGGAIKYAKEAIKNYEGRKPYKSATGRRGGTMVRYLIQIFALDIGTPASLSMKYERKMQGLQAAQRRGKQRKVKQLSEVCTWEKSTLKFVSNAGIELGNSVDSHRKLGLE